LVSIWFVIGNSVNYIKKSKSSMNQKLKQVGLFAIPAVFSMSLTTSFVGDAEAKVSPSLQQVIVQDLNTRPGTDFTVTGDEVTFRVVYVVLNSADIDLENVEILVTSDTESVKGELEKSTNIKFSVIRYILPLDNYVIMYYK